MSLEDGKECDGKNMISNLFCKEGSGCGRSDASSTGYACMEITTKLSDEINCTDDSDCPADAFCECNSINGFTQCIPYTHANETTLEYYKKYLKTKSNSLAEKAYLKAIADIYYPYDKDYRCIADIPIPPEENESSYEIPEDSDESSAKRGESSAKPLGVSIVLFAIIFINALF